MVKGDARFLSIAAASVLAKTWRDAYMEQIDQEFPEYRWMKNRGYPTREHYAAIARIGITVHHRRSFKLFHDQLKLPF
jgi:ribonuclease HII